jgi:hypothetical protein
MLQEGRLEHNGNKEHMKWANFSLYSNASLATCDPEQGVMHDLHEVGWQMLCHSCGGVNL